MRRLLKRLCYGFGLIGASQAWADTNQIEIQFQPLGELLLISDLITFETDNRTRDKMPPSQDCRAHHFDVELIVKHQGRHGTVSTRQQGRVEACKKSPQKTALVKVKFAKGDHLVATLTLRSRNQTIAEIHRKWTAPLMHQPDGT